MVVWLKIRALLKPGKHCGSIVAWVNVTTLLRLEGLRNNSYNNKYKVKVMK